jgi:signal peptidase II
MTFKSRTVVTFLILFACIGCDRITKTIAKEHLPRQEVISLWQDTVHLQYVENTGAFLSFGSNVSEPVRFVVFTLLTGLFLSGLLIYQLSARNINRLQVVAIAMVLGGGYGNLIDRIFNGGRVFDFLNVGIGQVRTGIFNIADMSITFGVLWFLALIGIEALRPTRKRHHESTC